MLYFLWGVFRGSRSDFSDSFKKLAMPSLNGVPRDKDIPAAVMTSSENLCVPECIVKNTSACDSSSHVFLVANAPEKPSVSLNGNSDDKVFNSQTKLEKQDGKVDSRSLTKIPRSSTPWYPETRCNSRSLVSFLPHTWQMTKHLIWLILLHGFIYAGVFVEWLPCLVASTL